MFNFIDSCLQGDALVDEIDDYVDRWHDSDDDTISLRDYLGMNKKEYILWMNDPANIHFILHARYRGIDVEQAIEEFNTLPMAARGSSQGEVKTIIKWLNDSGHAAY